LKQRVLLSSPIDKEITAILKTRVEIEVCEEDSEEEVNARISSADAIIVKFANITSRTIDKGRRLKVIGRHGVGLDNVDIEYAIQRGIRVVNTPGANANAVAEHTLGLLLALFRRIPQADASLRRGDWKREGFLGSEIMGKVMGIIGFGHIGRLVAEKCRALGMAVKVYDPYVPKQKIVELKCEPVELETLLRCSDVVSLHVPLTDETQRMMDSSKFALMKKDSVFINTSRYELVDMSTLHDALVQRRIAGAALDTIDCDSEPEWKQLLCLDNVIMTPHLGAYTVQAQKETARIIALKVLRELGEEIPKALLRNQSKG